MLQDLRQGDIIFVNILKAGYISLLIFKNKANDILRSARTYI
jgi:hypothetical protein